MENIKFSFYNILIPVPETQEYIIFNNLTGGLEIVDHEFGAFLESIKDEPFINPSKEYGNQINDLYEKKYFIPANFDEKKALSDSFSRKIKASVTQETASIFITVGTTINCNMGCPYCFQFTRPSKALDESIVQLIQDYIEDMILKSPVNRWVNFHVTWFGGEPLVNKRAIEMLTPKFLELCHKYQIKYQAHIITNGILLTDDTWNFLVKNQVYNAQITIDGAREIHDSNRPLKAKGQENYFKILENLSKMPSEISANIRMNFDRKVVCSLEVFFSDLEKHEIWPQKFKNISFTPAWLRTYEGENANTNVLSTRYSNEEFFNAYQEFRELQVRLFNVWAKKNKLKPAKLRWLLPERQDECPTWASPYGIVVDPQGYIHKCWETFHETEKNIHHVKEGYNIKDFKRFIEYDRSKLNDECYNCKFLAVCDQLSCAEQTENEMNKPPCTYWKSEADSFIKKQYLLLKNDPEMIGVPEMKAKANTGHSNK